jgi:hypothetical protein
VTETADISLTLAKTEPSEPEPVHAQWIKPLTYFDRKETSIFESRRYG